MTTMTEEQVHELHNQMRKALMDFRDGVLDRVHKFDFEELTFHIGSILLVEGFGALGSIFCERRRDQKKFVKECNCPACVKMQETGEMVDETIKELIGEK